MIKHLVLIAGLLYLGGIAHASDEGMKYFHAPARIKHYFSSKGGEVVRAALKNSETREKLEWDSINLIVYDSQERDGLPVKYIYDLNDVRFSTTLKNLMSKFFKEPESYQVYAPGLKQYLSFSDKVMLTSRILVAWPTDEHHQVGQSTSVPEQPVLTTEMHCLKACLYRICCSKCRKPKQS